MCGWGSIDAGPKRSRVLPRGRERDGLLRDLEPGPLVPGIGINDLLLRVIPGWAHAAWPPLKPQRTPRGTRRLRRRSDLAALSMKSTGDWKDSGNLAGTAVDLHGLPCGREALDCREVSVASEALCEVL